MSVHVSHGLLPDESKPHCRQHGFSMELVRADVPVFGRGMVRHKGKWAGRMIYRCKVSGCPSCWNGPTDIYHNLKEYTLETVNPW
jgi:hypothetical protein